MISLLQQFNLPMAWFFSLLDKLAYLKITLLGMHSPKNIWNQSNYVVQPSPSTGKIFTTFWNVFPASSNLSNLFLEIRPRGTQQN